MDWAGMGWAGLDRYGMGRRRAFGGCTPPRSRWQVLHRPLEDISVALGTFFSHSLPADMFLDLQSDGTLSQAFLTYAVPRAGLASGFASGVSINTPPHTFPPQPLGDDPYAYSYLQPDDELSYALSPEHRQGPIQWLSFDPTTRTLSGVPAEPGTYHIAVVGTDPGFRDGLDPPLSTESFLQLQVRDRVADQSIDYWDQAGATGSPGGG